MSHFKERKEKHCLNCGTTVNGRFCHNCGQENIEPKETVFHLVSHFFKDITHFDGKFFSTLKYLLFRPGFLSKEYMIGRRASYVNPIRMYVFTSAFFFLIFFSFFQIKNKDGLIVFDFNGVTLEKAAKMDSTSFAHFTQVLNLERNKVDSPMTRAAFLAYADKQLHSRGFTFGESKYKTRAEYDSLLAIGKIEHGWLVREFIKRALDLNKKYDNNIIAITNAGLSMLLHSLPQILFISLPLLALLLKLFYVRRKNFFYTDHAIFSLHYYIFIFMVMLVSFGLMKLNDQLHWGFITFLNVSLGVVIFYYLLRAMRIFYQQGWGKTIIKWLLLLVSLLIVMIILFIVFVFFSFLTI